MQATLNHYILSSLFSNFYISIHHAHTHAHMPNKGIKCCTPFSSNGLHLFPFFFFITIDIRVNLYVPQLIPQDLEEIV